MMLLALSLPSRNDMICCIADLVTAIPEMGGYTPHFRNYLCDENIPIDIEIDSGKFDLCGYSEKLSKDIVKYLETGRLFFGKLLEYGGFYLHSSSVVYENKGYLFSAPCGTGKSTHTKLWQQVLGEEAKVFNDDKTPLRRLDGTWYAYGAPWCGKDNININMRVPVAGICFLKQAEKNRIRRLSQVEAITHIIGQTLMMSNSAERLDLLLSHVEKIVREIPVFELENRPEPAAAQLSYETMRKAAEELGL